MSDCPSYGYNIDGIDRVNPRFRCIFCQLIIQDPIQLSECGHRCCRACFDIRAQQSENGYIICPVEDCKESSHKDKIMNDKAFRRELEALMIACMYRSDRECLWTGPLRDYQIHLDQVHTSFNCLHCQEHFTSAIALQEHQTRRCPEIFQACPLAPVCGEEMIRKDQFEHHLLSEIHQEGLTRVITGQYTFDESNEPEEDPEVQRQQREMEEKLSIQLTKLMSEAQTATDQTSQLSQTYVHLNEKIQKITQDLSYCRTRANEGLLQMNSVQKNQEKLQKDIEEVHELFDNYQYISTDGTLTWKVDRVADRMADAHSERQPSIYSPIFYSSPTGYKMRARLFLFGDGNARRTHMSLFFFLMKGEYDSILKWPFSHRITFCLLDQTGNNNHVIDSFQPDVKSNSFQRPKTDNNVASGIPKFFPLPTIQQDNNAYVREDTMYLKVIVELNETPRMMLPILLSLNPALPSHVQDTLAQQELLRRQQPTTTPIATGVIPITGE